MRRAPTLLAITDEGDGWLELELLHRPWWRRLSRRPRAERMRAIGITRALRTAPRA